VKPLHARYKLAGRLPGWAVPLAAAPIDLALRTLDAARSVRASPRLRADGALAPGDDTEALWQRARAQHGVVGEKSAAYLAWRYASACSGDHRFFGVRAGDGRLAGYAVYTLAAGKAFLRDLLAEDLGGAAEGLLLALSAELRAAGVQSLALSCVAPPAFDATLRRAGFLPRPGARPLILHPEGLPERLRTRAFDRASWFMLDGELDL
jgi:hypothetical protein